MWKFSMKLLKTIALTVVVFIVLSSPVYAQSVFRFASMSDAQDQGSHLDEISNNAAMLNPNFTVFNGDFSNDGVRVDSASTDSMQVMINAMKGNDHGIGTLDNGMVAKTFFVRGNHDDHLTGSAALWQNFFQTDPLAQGTMADRVARVGARNYSFLSGQDNLTYSFDYSNSRFLLVDVPGGVSSLTTTQINWIDLRLSNAQSDSSIQHVFISFHGPIYCTNYHCSCTAANDSSCMNSQANAMITKIKSYSKVSATFHGHEHVLGWTHMDNSRVTDLNTRTYEQFMTSPSGSSNYIAYSKPNRMTYEDNCVTDQTQGFGVIDVDGLTFKVRLYRHGYGTADALICKQMVSCIKDATTGNTSCTNSPDCTTGATPTPTSPIPPTSTKTPTPSPSRTPTPTLPQGTSTPPPVYTGTLHFTANESGAYADAAAIGFNVHDTGMSTSTINALPAGSQAMVWVGIGSSNCSATLPSTFTSFVLANATNQKLYGFYLTDEPIDATCVAAVTAYTNYIHANAPGKKSFILLTDWPGTYAAYRPAVTGVDLIGLDPYPVKGGTYDNALISKEINNAIAVGIPLGSIVPVFQTFGGAGWDSPTAAQLTTILNQWATLVPSPPLDYAYSWGLQSGYLSEALVNRADWRDIMNAHNNAQNPSVTSTPVLTTTPIIKPGDANGDGVVNETDYSIWVSHFQQNTSAGPSVGDFNTDGTVDGVDYVIWLNNL